MESLNNLQPIRKAEVLPTILTQKAPNPYVTIIATTIQAPSPALNTAAQVYTVIAPPSVPVTTVKVAVQAAPVTYGTPVAPITYAPIVITQTSAPPATDTLSNQEPFIPPNNGINDAGVGGTGTNSEKSSFFGILPIMIGVGLLVTVLLAIGAVMLYKQRKKNQNREVKSFSNLSHPSITFPIESPTLDFKKSIESDLSSLEEQSVNPRVYTQYASTRNHERYIPAIPTRFKQESYRVSNSTESTDSLDFDLYGTEQSFITFASGSRPLTYLSFESITESIKNKSSFISNDFPKQDHRISIKSTSLKRREGLNALTMELTKVIGKKMEYRASVLNQFKSKHLLDDNVDELDDLDKHCPPAPTSHVVAKRYEPRNQDECVLLPGDLIAIEKIYSDGYARAQNVSQARKRCILPLAILTPITTGPTQIVSKRGLRLNRNSFSFEDSGKLPTRTTSVQRLSGNADHRANPNFLKQNRPEIKIVSIIQDGENVEKRTEVLYTVVKKKFYKNETITLRKKGVCFKAIRKVFDDCGALVEETEFDADQIKEMAIKF